MFILLTPSLNMLEHEGLGHYNAGGHNFMGNHSNQTQVLMLPP